MLIVVVVVSDYIPVLYTRGRREYRGKQQVDTTNDLPWGTNNNNTKDTITYRQKTNNV